MVVPTGLVPVERGFVRYEPASHRDEPGGDDTQEATLLVTNPGSTGTSPVGASSAKLATRNRH